MRHPVRLLVALLLVVVHLSAQTGYRQPDPALAAIVDAPLLPELRRSPAQDRFLLLERAPTLTLAELAAPELRLAGLRFNPERYTSNRALTYARLTLKSMPAGVETPVRGFPDDARLAHVSWSADGRQIAVVVFSQNQPGALWTIDVATATARALTGPELNGVLGSPVSWIGHDALLVKLIPADRGAAPLRNVTTLSPVVQQSKGEKAAVRTFQDLLKDPQDEAAFDYYATSELVRVSLDGQRTPLGLRGVLVANASPDGRYFTAGVFHRPYSYLVPANRFPLRYSIHDATGKLVREIADLPLAENLSPAFDSTRPGPRNFDWRADAPATLAWIEARDHGDATQPAEVRDQLMLLAAPFAGDPAGGPKFGYRVAGIAWGNEACALVSENWIKTRRTRTWRFSPADPSTAPALVFDRSSEDRYGDPGAPVTKTGPFGEPVLHFGADGSIFLRGQGASAEGDRPFLDRYDFASGKATRLWQSTAPHFEEFATFLDDAATQALTRRESPTEPPNYFVRDLTNGAMKEFTHFPNPFPQFAGVKKEIITYARADGVQLTGTLYLPPDWTPAQGPLPTLLWAYPREFKSADAAGQVRDSPYRFVRVSAMGPLPFLLKGYAVLDDPAMPIIGEGKQEPNDTYIAQLVASAKAAVDELVRRGVTDRDRVAVGGHSYGAFMTANLLAHSNLFRAGIARSGAYNRTLTPFGFQAEERSFWEAPEIYGAMSPFNHANKIKDALLLIHGQADDNSGTFPVQSERFYQALTGLGATARYVQLPYEAHGYRARESLLHMLWEESNWLDTYVKKPATKDAPVPAAK
ncbi:MAG: S9 family peptidase [Opitutus sp.]|nr:S9 family peptidase [Opitutus sp.]